MPACTSVQHLVDCQDVVRRRMGGQMRFIIIPTVMGTDRARFICFMMFAPLRCT